jgi:hypothetical protein
MKPKQNENKILMKSDHRRNKSQQLDAFAKMGSSKDLRTSSQVGSERKLNIPRNVNFYRHLMESISISEKGVEWVIHLRSPMKAEPRTGSTIPNGFSFGDKKLKCQETSNKSAYDLETKTDIHNVSHLLVHRIGPTPACGQVSFETGLRRHASTGKLRDLERGFTTVPKLSRKDDFPKFYPSYEEMNNIKGGTTKTPDLKAQSKESNKVEGYLNYPKYMDVQKSHPKNIGNIRHLYEGGKSMNMVSWELSMRNDTNSSYIGKKESEKGTHVRSSSTGSRSMPKLKPSTSPSQKKRKEVE